MNDDGLFVCYKNLAVEVLNRAIRTRYYDGTGFLEFVRSRDFEMWCATAEIDVEKARTALIQKIAKERFGRSYETPKV